MQTDGLDRARARLLPSKCFHSIISQKNRFVKPIAVDFDAKKVFHMLFSIIHKPVEKSVDYAEKLYFVTIIRLFSCIYA